MLGAGSGEGLDEGADEVGVLAFKRVLLGIGGFLDGVSGRLV